MIPGIVASAGYGEEAASGIIFVGQKTLKWSSGNQTLDFLNLNDGAGQAQDGDFFLAWATECAATAGVPGYGGPSGNIGNLLHSRQNDSRDNASRLDYGFIDDAASDDVVWYVSFNRSRMGHVMVFRNVDPTTPLDVTTVTSSGINNILPNPPSITPVTDGALIVHIGSGTAPIGSVNFSEPSDGSASILRNNYEYSAVGRIISMAATKAWSSGDGAFNPDQYSGFSNRTDGARHAVTLALRPA